jgi:acyl-coenzyme A synthetase/AMP-(fatty) acid ligase
VIHDLELLLPKFLQPRHCYRTLAFLLFDHIGGLDTLFYNLANGSCLVTAADHSPDAVCAAIAAHRVEVLPVSPSFINLLLLSGAHERHDLRSLRIITYGAEVMPESTLARLNRAFPNVKLLQKFGATEFGTMRSQSRSSDSVWIKIGGEGYQTRVVEGVLQIKAESAMLGYLNAPSPFTEDGWFNTGDRVERAGEYFKILGRQTEIINVGGQKVYPAEVESVIQEMENVAEVMVSGEKNPILGNIVCAKVRLRRPEDPKDYSRQLRLFCRGRLQSYQVPVRIDVVENALHGERFKKMRRTEPMGG